MRNTRLAVIMTCHNRRDVTIACLRALSQQIKIFDTYLTDDGSSDGTANAVRTSYPEVKIIEGNGNLFWVGGMHLAFAEALKADYDYYLWLNDDTLLYADAFSRLLSTYDYLKETGCSNSIVVGTTRDVITGKPTYGGAMRSKRWYSNKYEFVQPSNEIQECDTMYGNCILIPRSVALKVGNLDSNFIHNLGDLDYGLRARKLGCSVWIAAGYMGTCSKNSVRGSWVDTQLNVYERLKKALHVKNFPIKAWTIFTRRHSGPFWFIYWLLPYLRSAIGYRHLSVSPTFTED